MIDIQKKKINNCLSCFENLSKLEFLYHQSCLKRLFGTTQAPELNFSNNDFEKLALKLLNKSVAITGVQKKLSLELHSDTPNKKPRLTIIGALGGHYILKPSTDDYPFMAELECLTMRLADICGIKVAANGLIITADQNYAYITKRFERIEKSKLACEDLCQLSELLTENKYKSSAEKSGKIIKKYSSFPGDDLLRYFELTVFSFLTGNADMHLKNFSMLTEETGKIRLSPAYDLLATRLLISVKHDKEELALSVNGKKSNLKRNDFNLLAENLKIPKKSSDFVIDQLLLHQKNMIDKIKKSFIPKKMQNNYIILINERVKRLS